MHEPVAGMPEVVIETALSFESALSSESALSLESVLPVDVAVLDHLMVDLEDTDGEMRNSLIDSYLADGEDNVDRLVAAAQTGDSATTADLAHALRSSSALLGAIPLANLLERLEDSGRQSMSDLYPLALQAETEYGRVSESLSEVMGGPTPRQS